VSGGIQLKGRRIAVLAADGFERVELSVPVAALRAEGAKVEIVSLRAGRIRGVNLHEPAARVSVDRTLSEAAVADYDALLIPGGFINPDLLRYELHRMYVVDANIKSGARHINPRRTFYLDEDSWQILMIDHYDEQLKLWRYSEAPSVNYYEVPVFWSTLETHHDLKSGRYIAVGLDNEDKMYDFSFQTTPDMFSPQSLRQRGIE
jgi:hypothetical protein